MEWLANISIVWVLATVGVLGVLLLVLRLFFRRSPQAAWMAENVQVALVVIVVVFLVIRPFLFQAFFIPSTSMEPTLHGPPDHLVGDRLIVDKALYHVSNPQRGDIAVFKAPPQAGADEKEFIKRVIGLPGETVEVIPPRLLVDGRPLLNLSEPDWTVNGLRMEQPRVLQEEGTSQGSIPNLFYMGTPVRFFVLPNPRTSTSADGVAVDGRIELPYETGIETQPGLAAFGAEPGIEGTLFTTSGTPRLAVVRGRRLEYQPGHVRVNGKPLDETYVAEKPRYAMAPLKLGANEYLMLGDNRNKSSDGHVWGPVTRDRFIGRAEVIFWPLNRMRVLHWWLIGVLAGAYFLYLLIRKLIPPPRRGSSEPVSASPVFE